jgi:hypothetical protein
MLFLSNSVQPNGMSTLLSPSAVKYSPGEPSFIAFCVYSLSLVLIFTGLSGNRSIAAMELSKMAR